jgi:hypothetical protein
MGELRYRKCQLPAQKELRLSNRLPYMRDNLCIIIKKLDISKGERENFIHFIEHEAPPHIIDDIFKRLAATFQIANRLYWEAKLEEYMENGPPKYGTHQSEYENASHFLKEVWGDYIKNDVLYLDRLMKYDGELIPALRKYRQLHAPSGDDVDIPPPSPRPPRPGDLLEQVAANSSYSTEEVIRAAMAETRARQRQQRHNPSNG